MSEAIEYNDNGTITLTLDHGAYVLRMPNADEVLRWHESILDRQDRVYVELDDFQARVEAAEEGSPEHRAATRDLNQFSRRPNYQFTLDWLAEVTKSLSSPSEDFPSITEWPGWMVNQSLPAAFVKHWQNVPKVSGSAPRK